MKVLVEIDRYNIQKNYYEKCSHINSASSSLWADTDQLIINLPTPTTPLIISTHLDLILLQLLLTILDRQTHYVSLIASGLKVKANIFYDFVMLFFEHP